MPRKKQNVKVGTLDFETDPFLHGRVPVPFAGCVWFSDDDNILVWSNKKCAKLIADELYNINHKTTLYAHNGGKFDFHFLLSHADPQEILIINGRIAKMTFNNVTLIDSFLLMPFALAQYKKTKIDYGIFEADKRNKPQNKKLIKNYLLDDCRDLYDLVTGFHSEIGNHLTIGAAAFSAMKKYDIEPPHLGEAHDIKFRPFYFGGRCSVFKPGIYNRDLLYLDINSAYPAAMLIPHATGKDYTVSRRYPKTWGSQFVILDAISHGALPCRDDKGGLSFPDDIFIRRYYVTGFEIGSGLRTGTLDIKNIIAIYTPHHTLDFKNYIYHYYNQRLSAKKSGDKIKTLAYKYLLNSGYGKFATDPHKFKKWWLKPIGVDYTHENLSYEADAGHLSFWYQDDYSERGYYDVATAASITGYVRAFLWDSICKCDDVYYCDTDSIICKSHNLDISDKLGDFKIEAKIDKIRIAGKKMYTYHTDDGWHTASKGVKFNEKDILSVCRGNEVEWQNPAPTFNIKNHATFIKRTVKK